MFHCTNAEDFIAVQMTSDLRHVDQSIDALRQFLARRGLESRFFEVAVVAREALNNAVIHGNKSDPSRQVYWKVTIKDKKLRFYVRDEGQGFDWKSWMQRRSNPEEESGRGHEIFRLLTATFCHNRRGNAVCLIMPITP
jgi:serine/threonine-protein kinase RsbW